MCACVHAFTRVKFHNFIRKFLSMWRTCEGRDKEGNSRQGEKGQEEGRQWEPRDSEDEREEQRTQLCLLLAISSVNLINQIQNSLSNSPCPNVLSVRSPMAPEIPMAPCEPWCMVLLLLESLKLRDITWINWRKALERFTLYERCDSRQGTVTTHINEDRSVQAQPSSVGFKTARGSKRMSF